MQYCDKVTLRGLSRHFQVVQEKPGSAARIAEIVARHVDVSSNIFAKANYLNVAAFDKPFDRLYVYSNFDYMVKETVLEYLVSTH